MAKFLITYGSRPLAQRLSRALQPVHEVVLATCEEVPSVLQDKFALIPNSGSPVYAHELLKICLDRSIDYLVPLAASELVALRTADTLFSEYGISILIPEPMRDSIFIENPNSTLELSLLHQGKCLISGKERSEDITGLFVTYENLFYLAIIKE